MLSKLWFLGGEKFDPTVGYLWVPNLFYIWRPIILFTFDVFLENCMDPTVWNDSLLTCDCL